MKLDLTTTPKTITTQPAPFVYLEKIGPFRETAPKAWEEFHPLLGALDHGIFTVGAGLSRIDKSKQGDDAFVYQAGMMLKAMPESAPPGLHIRTLAAGKYASFLLRGTYAQLPEAYPAIFAILEKCSITLRDDFCIEKYLNDPATTPVDKLRTEILIPIE